MYVLYHYGKNNNEVLEEEKSIFSHMFYTRTQSYEMGDEIPEIARFIRPWRGSGD